MSTMTPTIAQPYGKAMTRMEIWQAPARGEATALMSSWRSGKTRATRKFLTRIRSVWRLLLALLPLNLAAGIALADHTRASDEVVFTKPECGTYAYAAPVPSIDGSSLVKETRGTFFCTNRDFPLTYDTLSGEVGKRIKAILSNAGTDHISKIIIADYIFSDLNTARYICAQFAVRPFDLTIYTQQAEATSSSVGISSQVETVLRTCAGKRLIIQRVGCDVFGKAACSSSNINTFHLKLMQVVRMSGLVDQIESSGNIGKGMYANLEDWVFFSRTQDRDLHSCVWPTLVALMEAGNKPQIVYSQCVQRTVHSSNDPKLLLLPFDAEKYYQEFHKAALIATRIDVVSMDFRDRRLRGALAAALRQGSTVNFIASSEWHYASVANEKQGTAEVHDIADAASLEREFPSQVRILFAETNFYSSLRNTLHHKFVTFRTQSGNVVLTGTTNMKSGAIRRNLDQAYIFSGAVADAYVGYVDWLMPQLAVTGEMPTTRPDVVLSSRK